MSAIPPPIWWANEEVDLFRSGWVGNPGDVKDVLSEAYSLNHAKSIWRHNIDYGDILYIFQAEPSPLITLLIA